jgi:hypothetical protein
MVQTVMIARYAAALAMLAVVFDDHEAVDESVGSTLENITPQAGEQRRAAR